MRSTTTTLFISAFIAITCILFAHGIGDTELSDLCRYSTIGKPNREKCSKCIQAHPRCAWCKTINMNGTSNDRCDSIDRQRNNLCAPSDIVFPESKVEATKNFSLSEVGAVERNLIQIKPQEYRMKLRPNDTQTIRINFRQAAHYPVDLYYLMDLSYSMSDDKDKLTQLGGKLARRMSQITRNFRLGFGSFIDKKIIPFVDPRPGKASTPCTGCVEPYGYHHHLTLTNNTDEFATKVRDAAVSGNLDSPEGGLDAIVQSLACKNRIGWRDRSRKIIVYSSDAGFHYAGDGRLGGVVIPNDGQCHMDSRNYYDKSTELDYPSIGQIHKIIRAEEANIIFAVTHEQKDLYIKLKDALSDISATVGVLRNDSSNIVDLIEDEYKNIAQKITMISNLKGTEGIRLDFTAICPNGVFNASDTCSEVKMGADIFFDVNVTVFDCKNSNGTFEIKINPAGLSETVTIYVEKLCDCNCAQPGGPGYQAKSKECKYRGDLVCGLCSCDVGYAGDNCICVTNSSVSSAVELERYCYKNNHPNSKPCEGRGNCVCGKCICFETEGNLISGDFCECDRRFCPTNVDGLVCSGPEKGRCGCDQVCNCLPGWSGVDCSCDMRENNCMVNGVLCSGRGMCICNACHCQGDYTGSQCQNCPTCPPPCVQYRDCVHAKLFDHSALRKNKTAFDEKCPYSMTIVKAYPEELEFREMIIANESCQFYDAEKACTYYFRYYHLSNDSIIIFILEDLDCPPPLPTLPIALGVIAGIVIIGLVLLLLWKLLTIIHDRREFAKFERERLQSKWDTGENPIFHPATTTFQNPTYGGK